MRNTAISWCHHTFNPWWGCVKVSRACKRCYAESLARRVGQAVWGENAARRFFGDKHWAGPLKWAEAAARRGVRERVFCASMADVCEDRHELIPHRERLCRLIDATGYALDWLLLTKRPENAPTMMPSTWRANPPPYAWWLTTVEDQENADRRLAALLDIPAAIRGVSMEPLVELVKLPLSLRGRLGHYGHGDAGLDWVIVGGESGAGAEPMHPDWVRSLRDQCIGAGVAFHFKQWGEWAPGTHVDRRTGSIATATWFGADSRWLYDREDLADTEGHCDDEPDLYRVGKNAAGRVLDGELWDQVPQVAA